MTPWERKRIARRVYVREWNRIVGDDTDTRLIMDEMVDGMPLEYLWDMALTGCDKHWLEEIGVQVYGR